VKVLSPAKINLFLEVVEKRTDGYHNLRSLMCCITLYDTISLDMASDEISISCGHPQVPEDKTNLAYRAADLFFKSLEKPGKGRISIEKKIPVGAGLGGGSSNAAAVLLTLNRYYDFPFTNDQLRVMGRGLGADVPFFILGKTSIATGIGEKLEVYHGLKPYHVVLINPGFSVSTAMVYKKVNLGLTKYNKINKYTLFSEMSSDIQDHLYNGLETVTVAMYPEINLAKELLLESGALGALMTGSGPTVFGLFADAGSAEKAYSSLTHFSRKQKFLAEIIV